MVMDDNKENIMPEGGEEAFDEKVVDESIDEAVDPSEEPVEENEADKKLAELEAKSAEYFITSAREPQRKRPVCMTTA